MDIATAHLEDSPPDRLHLIRGALGAEADVAMDPEELPVGTVTFLLSDVEGSTPQWEADPTAMGAAMARHEVIMAAAVAGHGGGRPLEQGEGDNIVAAFPRASDAAAAALAAQLAVQGESWPDGVDIRVRMALHTGEAHLQQGRTYAGPDLNRCARLRALAHGGQIVVSSTTHALLRDRPPEGVTFRDLGVHRLKGIDRPEAVHQLDHAGLRREFPSLSSTADHPHNLPTPSSPLIGRVDERAAVLALLDDARLVTLTGSGGSGKTRLALDVAHAQLPRRPDGVWWVDLAPVADPDFMARAVLSALGLRDEVAREPIDVLLDAVADLDLLVVLDNAEHLLDGCADVARSILDHAPGARILVTSREPVGLADEWAWRVPSLGLPAADADFTSITASDAARLFEARARQARPGFVLDERTAAPVAQICHRLDGIPLAIELAAARVRVMSPNRIAEGLDDRFRLLTGGGRRTVPRQQTLQSSVEWSHDLLDADERAAFRRLSVFAGGFTAEAAEAVITEGDLDPYAVLDLLTRLVDKSLVVVDADVDGGESRYRLLETMRQFAYDRLAEAAEVELLRARHVAWVVGLATTADRALTSVDQGRWLDRLEPERDNIAAAVDWAASSGDGESLWAITGGLAFFWVLHGHFVEARRCLDAARSMGTGVPTERQLPGRWTSAYVALYAGQFEAAYVEATEVIELARSVGDQRYLARALGTLGTIEAWLDPKGARLHLAESVEAARAVDDDWCWCDAYQVLGFTYLFQDDHTSALAALDATIPTIEAIDNHQLRGWDQFGRAWIHNREGRPAIARTEAEAAVRSAERSGDPAVSGNALALLAEIAICEGRSAEMIPTLQAELERHEAAGTGQSIPAIVLRLAFAQAANDDVEGGQASLDRYRPGFEGGGSLDQALLHVGQALMAMARHDLAGARTAALLGLEVADVMDSGWVHTIMNGLLGWIAVGSGEIREAERRASEALVTASAALFTLDLIEALRLLAAIAEANQNPAEAARLLGAARAALDYVGYRYTLLSAVVGEPSTTSIRAALGDETFASAWAEGAALSLDDAVAYAMRARGSRGRPALGWDSLTPTETTVVELVAEGLTNKQIAERMFISAGTVKTHLAHVFAKLDMANRAELAAEVVRRRSNSPESPAGSPV